MIKQTLKCRMQTILIINGPNLNMLGLREPDIYGHQALSDIKALCEDKAAALGFAVEFMQSNHEGVIIDWIQDAANSPNDYAGLIINPAAYTHTSVAIHDALKLLNIPIIEVHLSDPSTREDFRHISYVTPLASAVIKGQGAKGYIQALEKMQNLVTDQ